MEITSCTYLEVPHEVLAIELGLRDGGLEGHDERQLDHGVHGPSQGGGPGCTARLLGRIHHRQVAPWGLRHAAKLGAALGR